MKLSFLKSAFIGAILTVSGFVNASLITHNGYTLDTDTNIVSDGIVEWLQWSETLNESINTAVASFGSDGWTLASDTQMSGLFSDFGFNSIIQEGLSTYTTGVYSAGIDQDSQDFFIELFGETSRHEGGQCGFGVGACSKTEAVFGDDLNENGHFQSVVVYSDINNQQESIPGRVWVTEDWDGYEVNDGVYEGGVALTRLAQPIVQDVPEPSTIAIFALGIMGLASRRFKKQ